MTITMYGIKNCDTIKKARNWLEARGIDYRFHDYKAAGIDGAKLAEWSGKLGWEKLLNRAGTTFKKLPDADKADIDEAKAIRLMLAQPSMIKRPVLDTGDALLVGFKPEIYEQGVTAK
ncbi:arsenate reductase [Tardibacter chloracetimidivorans]|uniref:Arsenate reductase n=1 Tax=Tardibacter chloracetimidivorans TaxID=1921510 RepID=A0A1L3ZUD4_9SPHN|nr:ArsC family reductase [Tardibacter chloracetimidivorans]API59252.1 arsenate reductase [Tardibacter chloracetimidivorans]